MLSLKGLCERCPGKVSAALKEKTARYSMGEATRGLERALRAMIGVRGQEGDSGPAQWSER
jgi:hypothetical protein